MYTKTEEKTLEINQYPPRSRVFTDKQSERLYNVLRLAYKNNLTPSEIHNFFYNAVKKGMDIDTAIDIFENKIKENKKPATSNFNSIGSILEDIMLNLKKNITCLKLF